ncbi:hypothetical protein L1277_000394 [Okibacterium sp. HSC-33S16]|uniref:hypothetical protein n=1 Tax=Okibacterium sp. HSC-33S16 TaxID=2910965 RepID=UPI00209E5E86|nr:hypothetical protein [Okibacterium sp. HSC-33S16]MCP2030330.1 hypothetical protein [Okibacterium sp. HSC-33S16]
MTSTETEHPKTGLLGQWSAPTLMIMGVIAIPALLALLFNSFSAPDDAAFVRMAFAAVAGQTIAIVTVVGLFVSRIVTRSRPSEIITYAAIAVAVIVGAVSIIAGASDVLLQRLDLL